MRDSKQVLKTRHLSTPAQNWLKFRSVAFGCDFKVNPPTDAEIDQMKEGATLVSFIWRAQNPDLMKNSRRKN